MKSKLFYFLMAIFLISFNASAETSDNEASPEALFETGKALFNKGDYEAAAEAFRQAYKMKPTWKLFYNIGQSEAAAKNHGRALEAFEAYLSKGGDDVSQSRRDATLAEIESLRKMVGFVSFKGPDGAAVYINEIKRGVTPLPGPIAVAASVVHKVRIEWHDRQVERTVKVMGQQSVEVDFSDLESSAPSDTVPASDVNHPTNTITDTTIDTPRMPAMRKWGIITIGIGGAFLVAGSITGSIAMSKDRELVDACNPSCTAERQPDVDTRNALAIATDIYLPLGGIAVAAGILMATVFTKRSERTVSHNMTIHPFVEAGTGGAVAQWSF